MPLVPPWFRHLCLAFMPLLVKVLLSARTASGSAEWLGLAGYTAVIAGIKNLNYIYCAHNDIVNGNRCSSACKMQKARTGNYIPI